jgi:hypothetical protein
MKQEHKITIRNEEVFDLKGKPIPRFWCSCKARFFTEEEREAHMKKEHAPKQICDCGFFRGEQGDCTCNKRYAK